MRKIKYAAFLLSALLFLGGAGTLTAYYAGQAKAQAQLTQLSVLRHAAEQPALPAPGSPSPAGSPATAVREDGGILPEYRALLAQNPDLVGWLRIPGTQIDYPVMQRDNAYYLTRGFDEAHSAIGLPFLDERCDLDTAQQNLIIYGHNIKGGALFHDLSKFLDESYRTENPAIYFDTLDERRIYAVTSAERFEDRDLSLELAGQEDTLMLVTCSYHVPNGRLAVYAVRQ